MPENWAVKHLLQELSKPKLLSERDDCFTSLNMEQFSFYSYNRHLAFFHGISVRKTAQIQSENGIGGF